MVQVTLADGSRREFPGPVTVAEVARAIGPGLAKDALGGEVDGRLVDVGYTLRQDAAVNIVTARDPRGLEMLRHSTAHLLAYAVKELFPDAQVTIGPVIDNGFYYDFSYKRPFTPEDLAAIENKMHELAALDEPVVRRVLPRDEAVAYFRGLGEHYKAEIIASIPQGEEVSLYREGGFEDLCRGPHVPSTGRLRHFRLMKVAGAYWRGDHRNEMLQRIYGTAWATREELKQYLNMLEEAEKRDHRKLGRELDLFHMQEEAPGMAFWHPRGWAMYLQVQQYMRDVYRETGYHEVHCPSILDVSLWKKSGHWDNYQENMFFTESEKRTYAVKPMNCPGHVQVFKSRLHSYRDLPVRLAEFGSCTRNEPSGALHGLLRVRNFTQDDGHIFCTEDQIGPEVVAFHRQALKVYSDFGFRDVEVMLALRPDASERIGDDAIWDKAEDALRSALRETGAKWQELPGEGAFYGPKIEYHLKDAIGRDWQLGTVQVDFSMPGRLGAEYVGEDSQRHTPVMLHRAIVGSMERFIGILIEQYAGALPAWLAPVQAMVLNITDKQAEYARTVVQNLHQKGFRVDADLRNEKITYKIREHSLQKYPYILVVGDQEKESGTVAVRARGNRDQGVMPLDAFAARLHEQVDAKS